jgi:hypothetical protein
MKLEFFFDGGLVFIQEIDEFLSDIHLFIDVIDLTSLTLNQEQIDVVFFTILFSPEL